MVVRLCVGIHHIQPFRSLHPELFESCFIGHSFINHACYEMAGIQSNAFNLFLQTNT